MTKTPTLTQEQSKKNLNIILIAMIFFTIQVYVIFEYFIGTQPFVYAGITIPSPQFVFPCVILLLDMPIYWYLRKCHFKKFRNETNAQSNKG